MEILDSELELLEAAFADQIEVCRCSLNVVLRSDWGSVTFGFSAFPETVTLSLMLTIGTREAERALKSSLLASYAAIKLEERSLFTLVSEAAALLQDMQDDSGASVSVSASASVFAADHSDAAIAIAAPAHEPTPAPPPQEEMLVCLIYFHHIMADGKKRFIAEESRHLGVGGVWVSGFPGCVVCEGLRANTEEFIAGLKSLNWQEIRVRGELVNKLPARPSSIGTGMDASASDIDQARVFPSTLTKVNTLSEVARACKDAGCEDLYFTLRKT
jgi:hypothetical protein